MSLSADSLRIPAQGAPVSVAVPRRYRLRQPIHEQVTLELVLARTATRCAAPHLRHAEKTAGAIVTPPAVVTDETDEHPSP